MVKVLFVYIHGFLGSDESFEAFPEHLMACLAELHNVPRESMEAVVFPRFATKGSNQLKVRHLVDWLLLNATTVRAERVILMAHSMGGLLASDAYQVLYGVGSLGLSSRAAAKSLRDARERERRKQKESSLNWVINGMKSLGTKLTRSMSSSGITSSSSSSSASLPNLSSQSKEKDSSLTKNPEGETPQIDTTEPKASPLAPTESGPATTTSQPPTESEPNHSTASTNDPNDLASEVEGTPEQLASEDDLDMDEATIRLLVNIRGIITFDSPFYGLSSTVITSAGAGKVVSAIASISTYAWAALNSPTAFISATLPNLKEQKLPAGTPPAGWSFPGGADAAMAADSKLSKPKWMKVEDGGNVEAKAQDEEEKQKEEVEASMDGALILRKADEPGKRSKDSKNANAAEMVKKQQDWSWASIALAGAGAAAGIYMASGLIPIAAQVIPARALVQGAATNWALQQVEEVRSHAEFLYPLINTTAEMHARVKSLLDEMEKEKRVYFHGFYLELPPIGAATEMKGEEVQAETILDELPDDLDKLREVPEKPQARNFCVPPSLESHHLFENVSSPLSDEIDAHMHMFSASLNQNDYIILVTRTAAQVVKVMSY
ncbi:hypothetical protein HDU97_007348 [Phlyctochytrium planicorne]|nr:hypothetical protein HDU97_007348 [Phlyctochytrium planicorne]